MLDALLTGLLAGLAVAMPLGPVGVLVLSAALRHGTAVALPAGLAVASVDGLYALGGALGGAGLAGVLRAHEDALRAIAALVLLVVGAVGLVRGVRAIRAAAPPPAAPPARGLYARFFALTAVNPPTLATFAAVFLALDAATAPIVFGLGAFAASAAWHAGLVTLGGAAGARLGPRAHAMTLVAGPLLVLGLAGAAAA